MKATISTTETNIYEILEAQGILSEVHNNVENPRSISLYIYNNGDGNNPAVAAGTIFTSSGGQPATVANGSPLPFQNWRSYSMSDLRRLRLIADVDTELTFDII